jgi:hypothetical protein
MDSNNELMMELLMQDKADAATDQKQQMMVLNTECSSPLSLAGVVPRLGRRRTRIGIDSHVLFCLT